jgi:hypothetical protein
LINFIPNDVERDDIGEYSKEKFQFFPIFFAGKIRFFGKNSIFREKIRFFPTNIGKKSDFIGKNRIFCEKSDFWEKIGTLITRSR